VTTARSRAYIDHVSGSALILLFCESHVNADVFVDDSESASQCDSECTRGPDIMPDHTTGSTISELKMSEVLGP
jgi:hypothetical protein